METNNKITPIPCLRKKKTSEISSRTYLQLITYDYIIISLLSTSNLEEFGTNNCWWLYTFSLPVPLT